MMCGLLVRFESLFKTDIIGITMLSMLMNEDFNKYYDWQNYLIQYDVIKSRLNSLGQKLGYSPKLIALLQSCLEKNEGERASVGQLHEQLKEVCSNKQIDVPILTNTNLKKQTIDNHDLYSQVDYTERQSVVSEYEGEKTPRLSTSITREYGDKFFNKEKTFSNHMPVYQVQQQPNKPQQFQKQTARFASNPIFRTYGGGNAVPVNQIPSYHQPKQEHVYQTEQQDVNYQQGRLTHIQEVSPVIQIQRGNQVHYQEQPREKVGFKATPGKLRGFLR